MRIDNKRETGDIARYCPYTDMYTCVYVHDQHSNLGTKSAASRAQGPGTTTRMTKMRKKRSSLSEALVATFPKP